MPSHCSQRDEAQGLNVEESNERSWKEFFLIVACVVVVVSAVHLLGAHDIIRGFIDAFWDSPLSPVHPY